ncbi:hypothetical protein ACF0H5_011483 [Mactra antiquata]
MSIHSELLEVKVTNLCLCQAKWDKPTNIATVHTLTLPKHVTSFYIPPRKITQVLCLAWHLKPPHTSNIIKLLHAYIMYRNWLHRSNTEANSIQYKMVSSKLDTMTVVHNY